MSPILLISRDGNVPGNEEEGKHQLGEAEIHMLQNNIPL
jgi:hypothetical protein